jgi:hypothetical protein
MGAAGAVLAPAGPTALDPFKIAIASAASVGDDVYVAVVVDFGGGSNISTVTKCVPVASTARDSDALAAAVGVNNVSYSDSGLLCAIENYPTNGVQDCGRAVGNGTYDYWSYWHGTSGSWVYASDGPTEQPVASPADDVVGLKYQTNGSDNPNSPPPSPSVAASYAQICNASTEVAPSQTPTTGTTTTAPPPSVTATPGSTTAGSGPGTPATAPGTGSTSPAVGPAIGTATTTTTAPPNGDPGDAGTTKGAAPGPTRHADASAAPHQKAGGTSNPVLPVVLVAAVVAALGGLALFRWRRKPAEG